MLIPTPLSIAVTLALIFLPVSFGAADAVVHYQYRVIEAFEHSEQWFTQGLEFHQGLLYESSGLHGQSAVQIRSLDNTQALHHHKLDKRYFGEGITVLNNQVYQLTWQSRRGFIYRADNLAAAGRFKISTQGWGLTNNGRQLIYSDGSHRLRFLNPATMAVEKTLPVTEKGKRIDKLNELEWINGLIYANIWRSDWVVIIHPETGKVIGKIDFQALLPASLRSRRTDVLNGIAYDNRHQRLFVTGKNWPRLYHVELIPLTQ